MFSKLKAQLFSGLLISVLTTTSAWSYNPSKNWLNNLRSLENAEMVKTPDDGDSPLTESFNKAQKSIKIVIFHISNPNVVSSLVDAKKRGVDVTLIVDAVQYRGTNNLKVLDQMTTAGINVVRASKGFSISHEKTFLIDDKLLFISTMNMVTTFASTRDFGIFMTNKELIIEWLSVFNADLKNAIDQTKNTPKLSEANLIWSPINSQEKLANMIDSAESEIELMVENLGDASVQASLGNAIKRGVKVKIITPECVFGSEPARNDKFIKFLTDLGAEAKLMSPNKNEGRPYIHAKTLNIDHEVAYLGSENYSINSLNYARELGIIFNESHFISEMSSTFNDDWQKAEPFENFKTDHCKATSPNNFILQ
jgi:cardiolipin synthase A/B